MTEKGECREPELTKCEKPLLDLDLELTSEYDDPDQGSGTLGTIMVLLSYCFRKSSNKRNRY